MYRLLLLLALLVPPGIYAPGAEAGGSKPARFAFPPDRILPVCLFVLGGLAWAGICCYRKRQRAKRKRLEADLENRNNELMKQSSALARKERVINTLLEELERQKKILGDRYPPRLYARMRSLMEKAQSNSPDEWIAFEAYFDSVHQHFIERIRRQYPGITAGDVRMCCLLRMNLSTKEIAAALHISVRAVELRRYRLRKRMGLGSEVNLADFLMGF